MGRLQRKSLRRDTRGATMIEFAILAPIFFAILAAILETSVQYFAAQVFESGVYDASRNIRVGMAQREGWTAVEYKNDVCSRLYGLFGNCSDLLVTVQQVSDFKSVSYSVPLDFNCKENCKWTKADSWSPGGSSSVVIVQAYYRYPSILRLPFAANALGDGRTLISAATVFRNEPF
jgi:Flp pilus assembly protein TadG